MSEPDIRLQIKVKNARILRAMKAAGVPNAAALSRVTGLDQSIVGEFVNFKKRPITKKGEWRDSALTIATALHRSPEEIWPEHLQRIAALKTECDLDLTVEQFGAISNGEQSILDRNTVATLLQNLPARERSIVEMRYGLSGNGTHTLVETADEYGIGAERVRQIEMKAFRRMREAARTKRIAA